MTSTLKAFKRRALSDPRVKHEYGKLHAEFAYLDEVLKARAAARLTQAEVAERIGTTQSAVARLESRSVSHSPSMATLERYATALGCRLEVRFVRERAPSGAYKRAASRADR